MDLGLQDSRSTSGALTNSLYKLEVGASTVHDVMRFCTSLRPPSYGVTLLWPPNLLDLRYICIKNIPRDSRDNKNHIPRLTTKTPSSIMETIIDADDASKRAPKSVFGTHGQAQPGKPFDVDQDTSVWEIYNSHAEVIDEERISNWKGTLKTLLIFVSSHCLIDEREPTLGARPRCFLQCLPGSSLKV
jgi:hypothetical protein